MPAVSGCYRNDMQFLDGVAGGKLREAITCRKTPEETWQKHSSALWWLQGCVLFRPAPPNPRMKRLPGSCIDTLGIRSCRGSSRKEVPNPGGQPGRGTKSEALDSAFLQ
jgi:hypothetical protein